MFLKAWRRVGDRFKPLGRGACCQSTARFGELFPNSRLEWTHVVRGLFLRHNDSIGCVVGNVIELRSD